MKELKCICCSVYLGEMERGKIKKNAIMLCTECYEMYKSYESLANFSKGTKGSKEEMPDFFKDLMNGKIK